MNDRSYPEGVDCVWLASDRNGHVGAFVTGGVGPIPVVVLASNEPAIEDLEGMVCELPKTSTARLLVSVKRPDDFIEMAERGFFVYDWSDVHRTANDSVNAYKPVAIPMKPRALDSLQGKLGEALAGVKFYEVSFSAETLLNVCAYTPCREAGC